MGRLGFILSILVSIFLLNACRSSKVLNMNAIPAFEARINGIDSIALPSARKGISNDKREVKIVFLSLIHI